MDEFGDGDDADFLNAVTALERHAPPVLRTAPRSGTSHAPPTPAANANSTPNKVQQPTPQALPTRHGPSAIIVSPRQKGNPILTNVRSLPWEYGDIPADYVLGNTTCALFLSLKYHRLHPEYVYTRIRSLQGKYNLRILLAMVDIQNHEESLKELSKTSLINNLTLILCWSAAEAGRYLELYKSFEHAKPDSIKGIQSTTYAEKLVDFITIPRSINKTDAIGLVSAFGSIRAAVNAREEEIGIIQGWGDKKVKRWCGSVREGFRVKRAEKRSGLSRSASTAEDGMDTPDKTRLAPVPLGRVPLRENSRETSDLLESEATSAAVQDADRRPPKRAAEEVSEERDRPTWEPGDDEEEALFLISADEGRSQKVDPRTLQLTPVSQLPRSKPSVEEARLSSGVEAALAKLRKQ
ncbi:ssDNA endonuclease and repair protein rad10 [Agyrium rufum]|nr:ssDNA endonuclease and repair protein rad10 [Agyrium rufum]